MITVVLHVRAFLERRPAEAVGGAEAKGEGESEARHLLACDRVRTCCRKLRLARARASDAISSGNTQLRAQNKRSCERRGYAEIAMCRRQDYLEGFLSLWTLAPHQ